MTEPEQQQPALVENMLLLRKEDFDDLLDRAAERGAERCLAHLGLENGTVAALTLSAAALVSIVLHEGYTDRAVMPVKGDVPTIGFGTTSGVKLGDTTTPPKALARALTDVQQFEGALKQCVTVPLAQHEYDALVSFSYNVGSRAFCQSTLVRKLNAEDYAGACSELLRWRFFQGKDCALPANARLCGGLATRRQAEYQQCLGENVP